MTQATMIGRLSGDQSSAIQSLVVSSLMAAALILPYAFLFAAPALLLVGIHILRHSSTGVSRSLGWLAIVGGSLVIASVGFVLFGLRSGLFIAGG
jgi:hypothetical protein